MKQMMKEKRKRKSQKIKKLEKEFMMRRMITTKRFMSIPSTNRNKK
jgi:hypothetical protein